MPEVVGRIVDVSQHPARSGVRFRVDLLQEDAVRVYSWFSREGRRLKPGQHYRIHYVEKAAANGGAPFRNITSAELMNEIIGNGKVSISDKDAPYADHLEEPRSQDNKGLGQLWEPPPGFRKPRPNPIACVNISAKQWNADNPDAPVTQRMLCEVMRGGFLIKADSARQGLAQLRPDEALELAGSIARGELAGQQRRADEPTSP